MRCPRVPIPEANHVPASLQVLDIVKGRAGVRHRRVVDILDLSTLDTKFHPISARQASGNGISQSSGAKLVRVQARVSVISASHCGGAMSGEAA